MDAFCGGHKSVQSYFRTSNVAVRPNLAVEEHNDAQHGEERRGHCRVELIVSRLHCAAIHHAAHADDAVVVSTHRKCAPHHPEPSRALSAVGTAGCLANS